MEELKKGGTKSVQEQRFRLFVNTAEATKAVLEIKLREACNRNRKTHIVNVIKKVTIMYYSLHSRGQEGVCCWSE